MEFKKFYSRYYIVFSFLLFLFIYFILTKNKLINTLIFVPIPEIYSAFYLWFKNGNMLMDIFDSLYRLFLGFSLGLFFGILIPYLLFLNKFLYYIFLPYIEFMRFISPLAWIPFAIALFHLGDKPAIFLVAIASFFPIFTNTYMGINKTKKIYIETAKIFGFSKFDMIKKVYFPFSLPYIFNGIKISSGIAWYVLVAAEMLGSQSGLGYVIQANKLTLQMEFVTASIIVIGIIGYFIKFLFEKLEFFFIKYGKSE